MSVQVTTNFVDGFRSVVDILNQQMESRLQSAVRVERQNSKREYFEQIGSVTAQQVLSRHGDVEYTTTPHQRRAVDLSDYYVSDLIDNPDRIRLLIDPTEPYVQDFAAALNRQKDQTIIDAATGNAKTGVDGTTLVGIGAANQIAVNFGGSNSGLTLGKIIEASSILNKNEIRPGVRKYIVVSQKQIDDLLNDVDQVSNRDYTSIQALQSGMVDQFMGFTFIRTELLTLDTSTDYRTCFAFASDALLLSMGTREITEVERLPAKHYSTQVYLQRSYGATRMKEGQVVEITCDESP